MPGPYKEITAEEFTKITTETLPHQEIERAIIHIGGGGVEGMKFKTEVMIKAGWTTDKLRSYASKAELATQVFNRIREVLQETEDKQQIMERLAATSA